MKLAIAALAATAACAALSLAAPASAAIALGDTLQITYLFPDTSSVYQNNTTTFTGAGTNLPIIYTGTATFDANSVTLLQQANTSYTPAAFNGVRISDLSNASAFLGWVVQSATTSPFTYYQSGGDLYVNWQGAATTGYITIGGAAGVPEPATWALMIAGFGLAGAALRRRTAVAA